MVRILWTIAALTYREHTRRKLVVFVLMGSLLIAVASIYGLTEADEGAGENNLEPLVVRSHQFLQLLAFAIAIGVSMTHGEPLRTGEALTMLARPLRRWQYVVGRFLGSIAVVWLACVVMGLALQLPFVIQENRFFVVMIREWAVVGFNLTVLAGVGTLFSTILPSSLLAGLMALFVDRFAAAMAHFYRLAQTFPLRGVRDFVVRLGWWATPKHLVSPLDLWQQKTGVGVRFQSPFDTPLPENTVALALWGVGYLVAVLCATSILVRRKELPSP